MRGLMMDSPLTITSLMQYAEKVHPNTEIVSVTCDNHRHRYTLKDAFTRCRQLANALQTLGAEPDDCIATLAWNDYRHFELYYAISCSGMICHTVNPRLFPEQLEYIINHAEDKIIFVDLFFVNLLEQLQDKLGTVKGYVVMTDEANMPDSSLENMYCYETLLAAASEQFSWPELDENSASSLCYTSGTTGNPKGVLYSHRSTCLHAYAGSLPDVLSVSREEVVMPIVPMFHVNAWGLPYAAAVAGCKLVFPGPRLVDGETLTALIKEEKVSVSAGVPTIWTALLNYLKDKGEEVPSLKRVVVGGAACPLSIMEDFDRFGVYTQAAWGMTETSPLGCYNAFQDRQKLGEEAFKIKRLKAGRLVFGVEMKIVGPEGEELPWDGETFGALLVRGPWICSQYFKLESDDFVDGWFDTGDVATIDADGDMQITDRSKDVIKSGGEWISSIDLEHTAMGHPAVAQAAVIGMPHPKWDERPLLLVVRQAGQDIDKATLLAWFEGKVAHWWIPTDCLFVEELPHTATGKVSKKDLRERYSDYQFPE
ncbi:MAG: long-chain-fatty-acid--CoA ligase [Gammaproteobacteria bacterium]|nr:long-chain-fatty-acid--CoA ligase [Gammaproteobacteria bacterium]